MQFKHQNFTSWTPFKMQKLSFTVLWPYYSLSISQLILDVIWILQNVQFSWKRKRVIIITLLFHPWLMLLPASRWPLSVFTRMLPALTLPAVCQQGCAVLSDCSAAEALLNLLELHVHAVLSILHLALVLMSAWQWDSPTYSYCMLHTNFSSSKKETVWHGIKILLAWIYALFMNDFMAFCSKGGGPSRHDFTSANSFN